MTRTRLHFASVVDVLDINVGSAGMTAQLCGDKKTICFLSSIGMRVTRVNHSMGQRASKIVDVGLTTHTKIGIEGKRADAVFMGVTIDDFIFFVAGCKKYPLRRGRMQKMLTEQEIL